MIDALATYASGATLRSSATASGQEDPEVSRITSGQQTSSGQSQADAANTAARSGSILTLTPGAVQALQEQSETEVSRRSPNPTAGAAYANGSTSEGTTSQVPNTVAQTQTQTAAQFSASLAAPPQQQGQSTGNSSSDSSDSESDDTDGDGLTEEEEKQVQDLKARDREVRAHEQAHMAAGGGLAGGASYTYQQGPDGKRYVIGGEVQIDTSAESTPEATIRKMQVVIRAATAPAEPSSQDLKVAQQARAAIADAQAEARQQETEESDQSSTASSANESGNSGEAGQENADENTTGAVSGETYGFAQSASAAYRDTAGLAASTSRPDNLAQTGLFA